jgi:hypothetical protein
MISCSSDGPVLVGDNWLDVPSVHGNEHVLRQLGYLPGLKFNVVMNHALELAGLGRSQIYVTQAFHLLPLYDRSPGIPARDVNLSFDQVTRHELRGRRVVALGTRAAAGCRTFGIPHVAVRHPSARTGTNTERAAELAAAILGWGRGGM